MSTIEVNGVYVKKILSETGAEWICPLCMTMQKRSHICSNCGAMKGRSGNTKYAFRKSRGGKPDTLTIDNIKIAVKAKVDSGEW